MSRTASHVACAVVLVLTACGSRVDWEAHRAAMSLPEVAEAASPEVASVASPFPTSAVSPSHQATVAEEPDTEATAAPPPEAGTGEQDLDILLEITIEPQCVRRGEPVAARIVTEPRSELSLIVSYSDGDPHGQMGFGLADDEGMFVWRWAITPDVPFGPATLLVGSANNESRNGDATAEGFEVAGPEGCP